MFGSPFSVPRSAFAARTPESNQNMNTNEEQRSAEA